MTRAAEQAVVAKSLISAEALSELVQRYYPLKDTHCQLIESTMRGTYLVRSMDYDRNATDN